MTQLRINHGVTSPSIVVTENHLFVKSSKEITEIRDCENNRGKQKMYKNKQI